jgi:shikimate 5-dehydrogenase
VNVLGLGAGGAATAVPANIILSIVKKFVFIQLKCLK